MTAVVVDSTVIYTDPRLSRAHFRVVRLHAQLGAFRLIVPEVVVREAVEKFRVRQDDAYELMRKASLELGRLGLPSPIASPYKRRLDVEAYEEHLRTISSAAGVEIASLPEAEHEELLTWAVAKRKPFNDDGAGYRDALIWKTVVSLAGEGEVSFITRNTADFCDAEGTGLAPELKRDLALHRIPAGRVRWFRDLREFVETSIPTADRVLEELNDRLTHDAELRKKLSDLIGNATSGDWLDTGSGYSLPDEATDVTVGWLDNDEIEVMDAHELPDGEIVLDLSASGEASLSFFVPKWADDIFEVTVEDANWTESSVHASAARGMGVTATISYDVAARELQDNLDVTDQFAT
jgi:hypothetical protein